MPCWEVTPPLGIGKGSLLKKLKGNPTLQQTAAVFDSLNSTHSMVESAGEGLVVIYNGKKADSSDLLQHKKYHEKVATSLIHIEPKNLPPTSAAAKYHSYQVFRCVLASL